MTTAATHHEQENTPEATLFVAFELSEQTWEYRKNKRPFLPRARVP